MPITRPVADLVPMRRAIELCLEPARHSGDRPFGTVIVRDGKIIGEGRNRVATAHDPTAHSEIEAIRDACKRLGTTTLEGSVMYTSGEPCPMCAGAIHWAGIAHVWFGAGVVDCIDLGLGTWECIEEVRRPAEERHRPYRRLLAEETVAAMRKWVEG